MEAIRSMMAPKLQGTLKMEFATDMERKSTQMAESISENSRMTSKMEKESSTGENVRFLESGVTPSSRKN